jgi:hypothetical protein
MVFHLELTPPLALKLLDSSLNILAQSGHPCDEEETDVRRSKRIDADLTECRCDLGGSAPDIGSTLLTGKMLVDEKRTVANEERSEVLPVEILLRTLASDRHG